LIAPLMLMGALPLIWPSSRTSAGVVELVPKAPTLPLILVRLAR
jgi:hypothetical protein